MDAPGEKYVSIAFNSKYKKQLILLSRICVINVSTEIPLPCGTIYQVVNFVLAWLGINAKVGSVFEQEKREKEKTTSP